MQDPLAATSNEVTVKLQDFDTRLHALEALVPLLLSGRQRVAP